MLTAVIQDENGEVIGTLDVNQKTFKTGSQGFFGMGKIEIAGARYQAQIQLVKIGSKAAAGAGGEEVKKPES